MSRWNTKTIGEIMKLEYGKPLPKSERLLEGGYPAYGANGEKCRSSSYLLDQQSIIIGRKGSAGELNLTEERFWPLDVTYYITFDDQNYDLKFLYFLLKSQNLPSLARGVKPGINRNDVYSIVIQVPESLNEQERIVSILDEAFAAIDKAKENAEKNLLNAQELFESYLEGTFRALEKEGSIKKLGDVVGFQNGFIFKSSLFKEKGLPILRISNIQEGGIGKLEKVVYFEPKDYKEDFSRYEIKPKDLVIAMSGATTGKIALNNTDTIFYQNQRVGKFIPKDDLSIDYLYFFLLTRVERNLKISAGAAQPNLATKQIKDIRIPLPLKVSEQGLIVKKLRACSEHALKLKSISSKKILYLDELKQSLLRKAFSGEL